MLVAEVIINNIGCSGKGAMGEQLGKEFTFPKRVMKRNEYAAVAS